MLPILRLLPLLLSRLQPVLQARPKSRVDTTLPPRRNLTVLPLRAIQRRSKLVSLARLKARLLTVNPVPCHLQCILQRRMPRVYHSKAFSPVLSLLVSNNTPTLHQDLMPPSLARWPTLLPCPQRKRTLLQRSHPTGLLETALLRT